MKKIMNSAAVKIDPKVETQIFECIEALKNILKLDLLGIYLYGSSIVGGLQKYSDIDLFVVVDRATTHDEKAKLIIALLAISGIYMKGEKPPIEMTIVEKSAINPWHYPPHFDFQYGEWLRKEFEHKNYEPWASKEMPDLALLVTQVLLASKTLMGPNPDELLCEVPYKDFMMAITDTLPHLILEVASDTRNVLLTLARIWSTLETDAIYSKPAATEWVINRLPEHYRPVMERAQKICKGEEFEHWDDLQELVKPCAEYMLSAARKKIAEIMSSHDFERSIRTI